MIQIHHGDALDVLRGLSDGAADSLVTDPPAGIGFMGKAWDGSNRREWFLDGIGPIFAECLRVLKPGAHGLVWAIPRTSHWTATALEDAGFEIRDVVTHHFGSGFPKSLNLSGDWQGFGTALKPASEHWILVRKPLGEKNVAANVTKHGTGALNVDGCRVGVAKRAPSSPRRAPQNAAYGDLSRASGDTTGFDPGVGRWPANLILSHGECCGEYCGPCCPVAEMDRQSGELSSGIMRAGTARSARSVCYGAMPDTATLADTYGDSGGASRFFYVAKPARSEREAGLQAVTRTGCADDDGRERDRFEKIARNTHPTVKAVELMRWLCRLVTPPKGVVLDPFMGSGSTGIAATREGFGFIGIEREPEYIEIARARIIGDAPLLNRGIS